MMAHAVVAAWRAVAAWSRSANGYMACYLMDPLTTRARRSVFGTLLPSNFPVRRVEDTSAESVDTLSCVESPSYKQKATNSSDDPLCSTTGFLVAWKPFSLPLYVAICCKLLQTPANNRNCCGLFTKRLQSVAKRENLPIQRPEMFAPFLS
jgi:hypothetical protein